MRKSIYKLVDANRFVENVKFGRKIKFTNEGEPKIIRNS